MTSLHNCFIGTKVLNFGRFCSESEAETTFSSASQELGVSCSGLEPGQYSIDVVITPREVGAA